MRAEVAADFRAILNAAGRIEAERLLSMAIKSWEITAPKLA